MKSRELLGQMAQAGERIQNVDLTGAEGELMAQTMHTSDGDDFWEEHYGQLLEKVRGGIYPATMDFKTVLQYTEGTDVLTDGILVTARGEKNVWGLPSHILLRKMWQNCTGRSRFRHWACLPMAAWRRHARTQKRYTGI